ncbi:cell division topological specificity factor homolog, chloroplastic-like isoform X2 [Dendrobium catenatum]|uniref:Cell division topological specificity factor like, chloroplastic n=1 Tax=Dendrobium catenatum TaxID=906689 RepID=A0A2I0VPZ6_9ASPA|nr:cell division topological specificity factor homolog, chloroplastic-like isoform X2 [Dendrobium catenatum]PKU65475.1 Cell division topological specificity factor like, chloroplastic [Dendrobium catenatum]
MAITGDPRVLAALNPFPKIPSRLTFVSSSSLYSLSSKMQFSAYAEGATNNFKIKHRSQHVLSFDHNRPQRNYHCYGIKSDIPSATMNQDADVFLLNAVRMSFLERLALAWKILFPTTTDRRNSNAKIAKQRLKMILFADRCAVSDEAKQKIVSNIIKALSDFVEIESQDKVQLSVSTDIDLGTMYSVTVPVRRVKPGYQQSDEEYSGITGIEFKDRGETSGCVDVQFDFYVPSEKKHQIP